MTYKVYDETEGLVVLEEFVDPFDDDNTFYYLINEATNEFSFATKNKKAVKSFKDFLLQHPFMTGTAVSVGLTALDSYRSNKRITTRFFAQNHIEKKMYADMVAELEKTGKYKVEKRAKRLHGGWLWELKRLGH